MNITLRPGCPEDASACGRICYQAFKTIAEEHGFPPDFPDIETAIGIVSSLLSHPGIYSVVAEADSRIVGSNFMDERTMIGGIGPITIDPAMQNQSLGRRLMENVIGRADTRKFPDIRLVQSGYHNRSLSLYTKLGFETREPLSTMQGRPIAETIGYKVRPATLGDLEACNHLCQGVHGFDRGGDLDDAIRSNVATVVERSERVTGYSTGIAFAGHSVGENNEDLKALIAAAKFYGGPGFLVPIANGELMRWCYAHGLKLIQQMTLMTRGLYNEPLGAWPPSIFY